MKTKLLAVLIGALALAGVGTAYGLTPTEPPAAVAAPAPVVPMVVAPTPFSTAPTTTATPEPTTTTRRPAATTTRRPVTATTTTRRASGSSAGCGQRAVAAGRFNPSCSEYQGYLDPGRAGSRGPSSGELQTEYGCEQGYIPASEC